MTTTETVQLPAAGAYRLDPSGTTITFTTRHFFGLAPVRGTFRLRSGHVDVTEPPTASGVRAVISASSFTTGNSARDTTVRSATYLDAEHHPDLVFTATTASPAAGSWSLDGTLTVRGATRPVTLTIHSCDPTPSGFHALATTRVDRYAFGLTAMRGMTGRHLTLRLEIRAEAIDTR